MPGVLYWNHEMYYSRMSLGSEARDDLPGL